MDQELIGEERPGNINAWPRGERPRERLLERGAQALSDAELLAVVLGTGTAGANALDIARQLLQHFSGNIDAWDPAVVNALAADRPVIAFDNAGVGRSTGQTPDNIPAMARDAVAFINLLGLQLQEYSRLHGGGA